MRQGDGESFTNDQSEHLLAGALTHHFDDAKDLVDKWFEGINAGGTSRASVPEDLVQGVVAWLTARGWPDPSELAIAPETLHFALPPVLR